MPQFDWTTDSDPAWNAGEWADEPPPPAGPSRNSRRVVIALMLVLLVAGGYIAVREVQGRVEDAESAVKAEIGSSYNLLTKAAAENDSELLGSLLSGRDVVWAEAQRELVSAGHWLPAPFFAYPSPSPADSPLLSERQLVSIELSPDLREAVATSSFLLTTAENGRQQSVRLQRPELYRLGQLRWLLSEPDSAFWGANSAYRGEYISVRYPARDKVTAVRLADDLDRLLGRMCREATDLPCPDGLMVSLTLESDSSSLLRLDDGLSDLTQGLSLTLPTISLVGVPVDEAGYQLIYQAYARRAATVAIAQQAGWNCCRRRLLFQALADYQLSRLQLGTWPITDQSYEQLIAAHGALVDLGPRWGDQIDLALTELESWRLYAFIDWLANSGAATPEAMLRELTEARSFSGWLLAVSSVDAEGRPEQSVILELDSQWQLYAAERSAAAHGEPPIAYPEEALWLVCQRDAFGEDSAVFGLQPADEGYSLVSESVGIPVFAGALPGDGEFLISSMKIDSENGLEYFDLQLISQMRTASLLEGPEVYVSTGQVDPTNRYLVVIEAVEDEQVLLNHLLDYKACEDGACELLPIPGMPIWSPSGQQSLLVDSDALFQHPVWASDRMFVMSMSQPALAWPLYRGDQLGQVRLEGEQPEAIGIGSFPFWIDESRYGYVRSRPLSSDSRDVEVVVASTADDLAEPVVGMDELRAVLTLETPDTSLSLRALMTAPKEIGLLFLLVTAEDIGRQFVISHRIGSGETKLRFEGQFSPAATLGFSPDGGWFTMATAGSSAEERWLDSTLYLNHVQDNRTVETQANYSGYLAAGSYDWSDDGEWLAVTSGRYAIKLMAPDYGYHDFKVNSGRFCSGLWWMK